MRLETFLLGQNFKKKEIRQLLKRQEILVEGQVPRHFSQNIDPYYEKIQVAGKIYQGPAHHYFLFHKPKGVVTSHRHQKENDKIVLDFFPAELRENLSFVGRLDKDTTGLVFFTDNGQLNYALHQAKKGVEKTYLVTVKEPLEIADITKFAKGLQLDGDIALQPAKLVILDPHHGEVTLTEGKFHQVKKMFLSVGKKVVELHRLRIGPLELPPDLEEGSYRLISLEEFQKIKEFF